MWIEESDSFYEQPQRPSTLLDNLNKIAHLTKRKFSPTLKAALEIEGRPQSPETLRALESNKKHQATLFGWDIYTTNTPR